MKGGFRRVVIFSRGTPGRNRAYGLLPSWMKAVTAIWLGCILVQRGDGHSSKAHTLSPTPGMLSKLAQSARTFDGKLNRAQQRRLQTRSLRRKLSPSEIDTLVARYLSGETTPALSKEFGISKSGLLGLLRDEGAALRKQSMTKEAADRAAQMYQNGLSITEVVKQIGYSYSTVRKSLHQSGVVMRPKGIKRSSL